MQPKSHHRAHYETEGSRGAVKASAGGHPSVQVAHRPGSLVGTPDGAARPPPSERVPHHGWSGGGSAHSGTPPPLPSVCSVARGDIVGPCYHSLSVSYSHRTSAVWKWEPLYSEAALRGRKTWPGAGRVACPPGGTEWAALLTGGVACGASLSDFSRQPCCSSSGWTLSTCASGSDTEK